MLSATLAFGEGQQTLTLKQAVTLAVQSSSEVALARARYGVAEQRAALEDAPFGPNLFAGSGVGYTYGFPMTPGGAAPALFNVSYVQTLFNPPLKGQVRAAERHAEVERLILERSRDAVILRTAGIFLNLAQMRQALDARRGMRDAVRRIQDITDSRVVEGHELPVERLHAKLAAARAEQAIVELEGSEEALATELRELTGIPRDRPLDIVPESLAAQPEQPLAELLAHASAGNTELQQAVYEQRARTDRLRGERGGYWPAVDLVGEYAMLGRFNNYDEFFRRFQRHNLNVGIQARWSILSAQTTAAVRLAELELRQMDVELSRKREEIEATVRRAL
jgi:outer membrane protein TolC